MSDQATPIDFDAMTAQLEEMSRQIGRAARELDELKAQRAADRVAALDDGFWLVQADRVVRRLDQSPKAGLLYAKGIPMNMLVNNLRDLIRACEEDPSLLDDPIKTASSSR